MISLDTAISGLPRAASGILVFTSGCSTTYSGELAGIKDAVGIEAGADALGKLLIGSGSGLECAEVQA
jgi:hypothetical protein